MLGVDKKRGIDAWQIGIMKGDGSGPGQIVSAEGEGRP